MKRLLLLAGVLAVLAFPLQTIASTHSSTTKTSTSTKKVYVKGYYRKDGTYVAPHYRAASGSGQSSSTPKAPSVGGSHSTSSSSGTHSNTGSTSGGCQTCPRDANGRILRSSAARTQFLKQTGYPHGRPGYVVDHIVPLECGGADTPSNMQWQTVGEAKAKDKTEGNCRK